MNSVASSRRGLLAGLASGLAAVSGCLSAVPGSDDEVHEMGAQASDDGERVTVSNPRVQRTFVYDNAVWREMKGEDDTQYLVVEIGTEGFDRARTSFFDVAVGGEALDADGHALTGDAGLADGGVAFPVPVGPADEAAVVWERSGGPDVRWRVPEDDVANLAHAPEFRVREVTFTHEEGLGVAVENVGDRDGTFRLWISAPHAHDISHLATWGVPAGETAIHRVPAGAMSFAEPDGNTFQLDWGTGATERSFEG